MTSLGDQDEVILAGLLSLPLYQLTVSAVG